ncbi:hypothetical protein AR686_01195 [Chryseobacterium aquaticum subsp. greenlandense]|uniref:Fibronectin type-III domain-containing protein n=2 Tax=Chryseobacterium aquaticum TaxID=452084 RepID=A0A101CJK0_9FLAO|nr:hypothetical protein AR686_01195 [Chryseobacterium aquaticum subsp. greenlandense]
MFMVKIYELSYRISKIDYYLKFLLIVIAFFAGATTEVNAQVSAYTFAQSTGTYTSIAGTALGTATGNASATNLNSEVYPVTFPFNFNFNGTSYSSMNVSTNGFITFGSTAPSTTYISPISGVTAYEGAISAWGRDISSFFDVNGRTGSVSWEAVGTAPNREIVIQWSNFRTNSATAITTVFAFSFQIRLQETSNIIKVVYDTGSFLVGSTAVSGTSQIGLRGSSNSDFNNRLNATTLEFYNSAAGTANSSNQAFNTNTAIPGMPTVGLTYTWTPPTCYIPSGLSVGSTSTYTANLSWGASPSSPSGYDIYYSTSNTPPVSSTVPTVQNVPGTNYQIGSLSPLTTYYVWIRSNCGAGNVSFWTSESILFTTSCIPPNLLSSNGVTVCPNNPATLSATANTGVNLNWYDAATGGNLVFTGSSFTTPPLVSTTNYYVTASTGTTGIQTAKPIYSPSPSSGAGTTNFGLVFDALGYFILESVTVYPVSSSGASGTLTIDVINSSGAVVNTKTVNVVGAPTSAPVAQVINLNFPIFPGLNYKIRPGSYTGISGLLFDPSANAPSGNYGYPYTVQNLVTIQTSTLTAAPTNTARNDLYYYFYDWKIGTKCESPRTMVTATVDTNCLSTSEIDKRDAIKVYPNPFSEIINITKSELVKTIRVSDLSGKLLRTINQPEAVLRLNDLSAGMYLLQLDMKDGSQQSIKIVKK